MTHSKVTAAKEKLAKPEAGRPRRRALADALSGSVFWVFILPCIDVFLLGLCIIAASEIRLGYVPGVESGRGGVASYLIYGLCIICGAAISGAYRQPIYLRKLSAAAEFILGTILATASALFLIYAVFLGAGKVIQESRAVLLMSSIAFVPTALLTRAFLYRIQRQLALNRPYLIIGSLESFRAFSKTYKKTGLKNPILALPVEDIPPDDHENQPDGPLVSSFWKKVELEYEAVILTEPPAQIKADLIEKLARMHFSRLPVLTLNAFYSLVWRQAPTLDINPAWVFENDFSLAERSYYRYLKRGFDIVLAVLLLSGLFPLLILVALAIKLDSHGPVFFRQLRVGRHRRIFSIRKFRTMIVGAETGAAYTSADDPRITRLGRILRILRFDEMPQLFNVLSGDMSLIGPRPEWVRLVATYESEIPFYHLRHLVKPGITGWAQLNFRYGESLADTVEKLGFDLYYIRFYSPILDLEILLKTILHVFTFRGR